MTRAIVILGLAMLISTGCNLGRCGNDDDMEPTGDDDTSGGDDDTAGDDDTTPGDDDDDDDTEFAPCDDDTADGTWIASYEGAVQLEIALAAGSSWSIVCAAEATMAGHAHSFAGQIDCGDPTFAALPLSLVGEKSGGDSCIDGEIGGEIAEIGDVAWPWIGSIDRKNVNGLVQIDTTDLTVHGDLDLAVLPLTLVWVQPDTGYITGGIHVTLTGAGFTAPDDMTVHFGEGLAIPTDQCGGFNECEVVIPAADLAGPVDVTLTNANGTVSLPGGFTYLGS